jgi:hypothetical protein
MSLYLEGLPLNYGNSTDYKAFKVLVRRGGLVGIDREVTRRLSDNDSTPSSLILDTPIYFKEYKEVRRDINSTIRLKV